MSRTALRALLALAGAAIVVVGLPAGAHEPAATKIDKDTKVFWQPEDIKWEPFALPGSKQAKLWGDPDKGEHGALYMWPAGTTAPLHHHSHGDHVVIIAGTLVLQTEGGAVEEMTPGSYFSMAGGVKHTTACKAGLDCVFFVHREGKFDAVMAEGQEKPK